MGAQDYKLHEMMSHAAREASWAVSLQARVMSVAARFMGLGSLANEFSAAGEFLREGTKTYPKPAWGLPETTIDGKKARVTEEVVQNFPFMELRHFKRDTDRNDPKLLVVAPLSGHFATLLRGTVERMLPEHDVYVTDWRNARDVSMKAGKFDLDDYVDYVQKAIQTVGPNTHVLAVCQPTVPVLAAISLMAQNNAPNQPLSMTLMAGPIDTRAAPTEVTKLAEDKPMSFFKGLISNVPHGHPGVGRHVYPGHLQLLSFIAMNPDRHMGSSRDLFNHLRKGDGESADKIREFYNEYNAVLDMTEEFYLQTIDKVFQRQLLARGALTVRNQLVTPSAIRNTALLTVEGGKDDISAAGQTFAAHRLCTGIPEAQKRHLLHPEVGHYGTFSGSRFRNEIAPVIISHIREAGLRNDLKYDGISADTGPMPSNFGHGNGGKPSPLTAP